MSFSCFLFCLVFTNLWVTLVICTLWVWLLLFKTQIHYVIPTVLLFILSNFYPIKYCCCNLNWLLLSPFPLLGYDKHLKCEIRWIELIIFNKLCPLAYTFLSDGSEKVHTAPQVDTIYYLSISWSFFLCIWQIPQTDSDHSYSLSRQWLQPPHCSLLDL